MAAPQHDDNLQEVNEIQATNPEDKEMEELNKLFEGNGFDLFALLYKTKQQQ